MDEDVKKEMTGIVFRFLSAVGIGIFNSLTIWVELQNRPAVGHMGEPLMGIIAVKFSIWQKLMECGPKMGICLILFIGATILFSVCQFVGMLEGQGEKMRKLGWISFWGMVGLFLVGAIRVYAYV